MVGGTAGGLYRSRHIRRLFNMGGISECALHVRTVFVAVLRAGFMGVARQPRRSRACLVRGQAGLVSSTPAVLARAADSAVSRSVPFYLLLLSRRVLQSVLGGS